LDLYPRAHARIALVRQVEERGHDLEKPVEGELHQSPQPALRVDRAVWRHRWSGRGLVYWPVLCADVSAGRVEARLEDRLYPGVDRTAAHDAAVHRVRAALRSHRP